MTDEYLRVFVVSLDESLMILRFWREIATSRKKKNKQLAKHAKPKNKSLSLSSPGKKAPTVSLTSEITKAEFLELFEQISHTEQVFIIPRNIYNTYRFSFQSITPY